MNFNSVFSTDYDNYKVFWTFTYSDSGGDVKYRLRLDTTDETAANYSQVKFIGDGTSLGGSRNTNLTAADFGTLRNSGGLIASGELNFFSPFLARRTTTTCVSIDPGSDAIIRVEASTHKLANSYNGFTIFVAAGTFTGNVSVYGMSK
jgi:hypothetical protein